MHLLLDPPDADASEDVVNKYPMLACEVLCLEIKDLDKVLAAPQNLQRLFEFYEPNKRCASTE